MRKAREMTGWDVLAPLLLTFVLIRHALEYEQYRGLVCTVVYLLLTTLHAGMIHIRSRRLHRLLNISTMIADAAYPYLKWNGYYPLIPSSKTEPVVSIGLVSLLAAAAGCLTLFRVYQYLQLEPHDAQDKWKTPDLDSGFQKILHQKGIPESLNVWRLVPLTFLGICIYGIGLALPVGPLSDDGMIFFMEGGCDWGNSSVFFFSKLGLLVAINAAMMFALRERFQQTSMFIPHFVAAGALMAVYWNDYSCGLTQGNIAQMIAEISALAALMIVALPALISASAAKKLLVLCGINAWHVGAFQFALLYFPHWSWSHTSAVIVLTLLPAVFAVQRTLVRGQALIS